MPKYTNSTAVDITVGSYRFPANTTLEVSSYVEGALPAGLTLASIEPNVFNPVLLDQKYSAKSGAAIATINVPDSDTKAYIISFYVESGEFNVALNDPAATPKILVTEGATWTRKFTSKVVNTIDITCVTGGTIYVSIYKA